MVRGGCLDLRNAAPNSPVRVFSADGKLKRTEPDKPYSPGHFTNMPPSRRNEAPEAPYGTWMPLGRK